MSAGNKLQIQVCMPDNVLCHYDYTSETTRLCGDDVSLHSMGRSRSRRSTQSGGIPSSSYESYSQVNRKIYTCALQVIILITSTCKSTFPFSEEISQ